MRFRLLIVSLVAGAALALFAPDRTAQAQINQIDGSTGTFTAAPGTGANAGNYIINFTSPGATQAFNGVPIPLALQNVTTFSPITLIGANGGAAFDTSFNATDTGTKTILGLSAGGASFGSFLSLQWGVGSFQPRVLGIAGFESLLGNGAIPLLDLSPFALAGNNNLITISLNIAGSDFVTLFNSGTTFTGTGSFSQNASFEPPAPSFPEPSSLAIWGTLIGAGWLTRRLRRR